MSVEELINTLIGKTIKNVQITKDCDCGLKITFTDDSILEYGYSGNEGTTEFNNETILELI